MTESRSSKEFSHEEGAPKSKDDWEALSEEEKTFWEQRRRRRGFLRRHGHRAKGLASLVKPQDRSISVGLRGRGQLRNRRRAAPVKTPTPEQLADKPGLEPTREIPDSGRRGPSGNLHSADLRMVRRATRERWKITEEMTHQLPEELAKIINATSESNPAISVQAVRALAMLMAQNQADEHEETKRSSLTREQASQLIRTVVETLHIEVDDPSVRQRIASTLGTKLVELGVVNPSKGIEPPRDTPASPKYEH